MTRDRTSQRWARSALTLFAAGVAAWGSPSSASAQCPATPAPPISRFGEVGILGFRFDLAQSVGMNDHAIVGKTTTWSYLTPDGVNFDSAHLRDLDREIKEAVADGMKNIVMRIRTGGGGLDPFAGQQSGWPVDLTNYTTKDGEYLGARASAVLESNTSFPPKVLTRDDAGATSPWYDFVFTLASRYNGCTPDPDPLFLGQRLPRVDYWSTIHEQDSKSFWYGTSKDLFGGVGGDPTVGVLPSFQRAVKAANPQAKIVSGGASSQNLGYYMAFAMAQQHGNKYDQAVRDWGKSYFHTSVPLQAVFNFYANDDAGLYNHYLTDIDEQRSRAMIDAMFSADADDHYDIVGAHFYDNPKMLEQLVAFIKARQLVSKPLWLTELGFVNQSSAFNTTDQARWLMQKMVIGVASGVEHATYSPVMASATAVTFAPIFEGLPGSATWRSAAFAAQVVGNAIDEDSGFTFLRKRAVNGTTFYEFAHQDGQRHEAFAWRDGGNATLDLRATLGIPPAAPIDIVDYTGQLLWSQSSSASFTIDTSPVLIRWSGSTGGGCGRVADDGTGMQPFASFAIVLLPVGWAALRRWQKRPALVPVRHRRG